ncbi:MAG: hypothetical protein ABJB12_02850 [Pseudomonadota bacterium]
MHVALLQLALAWGAPLHIVPHAPQLVGSFLKLTHAAEQFWVPEGQVEVHLLPAQTWFGPHAWPQPPQFNGSMSVLTQALPHWAYPTLQVKWHAPALHEATALAGATQTLSHAPQ